MLKKLNFQQILIALSLLSLITLINCCPENCLFCLEQSQCLTCQNQHYLTTQGQCFQKSVENCRVYFPDKRCAVCEATFRIQNNECVKDLSGCLIRNPNGRCIKCHFGTALNIKGQCQGVINCAKPQRTCQKCRTGYNLINNNCRTSEPNCKVIQPNGLCSECNDDYILNGYDCISKASSAVVNGNINLIQKCSLYSRIDQKCLECQNGYELLNNGCQSSEAVYSATIDQANMKIRQSSEKKFIDSDSEKIHYSQVTYSVGGVQQDDVLGSQTAKQISRVTFEGVGGQASDDDCLIRGVNNVGCQTCIDGFYLSEGTCIRRTPVCQKYNLTNFKCLSCNENFGLANGECLDINCQESFFVECKTCKQGFTLTAEGQCRDPNCQTKKNGTCLQCITGFSLSTNNGLCYRRIQSCVTYSQNLLTCKECLIGFQVSQHGICVNSIPIDTRCLAFDSSNKCIQCPEKLALGSGQCLGLYCRQLSTDNASLCEACQAGYTLNQTARYCYDQNCQVFKNGSCVSCLDNYQLQNGFCIRTIVGCNNVDPATQICTQCVEIYKHINGECLFSENDRCSRYSTTSKLCQKCKDQFSLSNGECKDLFCQNQQLLNNFYSCTECRPGFNLSLAKACSDEHCINVGGGDCISCADGYEKKSSLSGLCVKTTQNCQNWSAGTRACTQCISGYNLTSEGACQFITQNVNPPIATDPLCRVANDQGQCTGCVSGRYYIRNNRCQAVPMECKSYNPRTGKCISCDTGFALYETEQGSGFQNCIPKPSKTDPNCTITDLNQFCIRCKTGFYISLGVCYLANTQCKTFQPIGGDCITCYDGFTIEGPLCISLDSQSNCLTYDFQKTCVECVDRYWSDSGICRPVNALCGNYSMSTGECQNCADGYGFVNNICQQVDEMVENCKNLQSSGFCLECMNRFYLKSSSECAEVNPLCNDYNTTTGWCKNCSNGYKLRTQIGQCVIENSVPECNQFSYDGLCISCIEGFFLSTERICYKLDPLCKNYNNKTGDCQVCIESHYLSFQACEPKFQRDSLSSNCVNGDSFNFCTQCEDRYWISSGECLKIADSCTTYNANVGTCLSCIDGFKLNEVTGACVTTADQTTANCRLFSGSLCVECDDRFYLKSQPGQALTCVPVNALCGQYNMLNGDCLNCQNGFTLGQSGKCQLSSSMVIGPSQNEPKPYTEIESMNCAQYDVQKNECVKCYIGYFYSRQKYTCLPIDSNCRIYDPINSWCLSCRQKYVLLDHECVLQSQSTPSSIKEPEDVLSEPGPENCKEYDQETKRCKTCFNGYQLLDSGVCSLQGPNIMADPFCTSVNAYKCVNCLSRYYVNQFTGRCTLISSMCSSFSVIGGECTQCTKGNILQDGACFKPALGLDPNCDFYSGSYCAGCKTGFRLISSFCQSIN